MKLKELKVKSFITNLPEVTQRTIKGGKQRIINFLYLSRIMLKLQTSKD